MTRLPDYNLEPPEEHDADEVECTECDERGRTYDEDGWAKCHICGGTKWYIPDEDGESDGH